MGKPQLVYTGKVRHEKDKNGKPIDIYETTYREKPRPCKTCKQRPRKEGSSRCAECLDAYQQKLQADARLQAKIDKQAQIKK